MELRDGEVIVQCIAKHYALMYCMSELIQLKEGLAFLKVLELMQANPRVTRRLLINLHQDVLTADRLYDMLKADLAPNGSNLRAVQETAYFHWINLMQEIEGKFSNCC